MGLAGYHAYWISFAALLIDSPLLNPFRKKAHAHIHRVDAFHVPDVRRQTADCADRSGGRMGLKGLPFIWGSHRLVSPSNLISANCNPHQYVLFIIAEFETDVCRL